VLLPEPKESAPELVGVPDAPAPATEEAPGEQARPRPSLFSP
jgi:hypothetical protein